MRCTVTGPDVPYKQYFHYLAFGSCELPPQVHALASRRERYNAAFFISSFERTERTMRFHLNNLGSSTFHVDSRIFPAGLAIR